MIEQVRFFFNPVTMTSDGFSFDLMFQIEFIFVFLAMVLFVTVICMGIQILRKR